VTELASYSFTIPGAPALEGVWLGEGAHIAVVAPPHPLMGGHLSNPVVASIADGLVAAGLRVLLFNFRGVGESEGDASGDLGDAVADYHAALSVARDAGPVVCVAGYSFGGATAARIALESGLAMIAVAPPPALLPETPQTNDVARCIIAGDRDGIADAMALRALFAEVPRARVHVVPNADHFFSNALRTITALVAEAAATA
jgi:alpha/beta superfamily hydrolase